MRIDARTRVRLGSGASVLLAALLLFSACDQPQTDAANKERARLRAATVKRDSTMPPDVVIPFVPPDSWERVRLSKGVFYRQPRGFTLGLNDSSVPDCDAHTPEAETPVFATSLSDRWPLTLAMRRGDLNRLARANGFALDSTIIATEGQPPGDSTRMRRGEGWLLLAGRTLSRGSPLDVLFGAVRYPGGCYLVLAARGVDINVDTLGYVLGTVRFGVPADSAPVTPR